MSAGHVRLGYMVRTGRTLISLRGEGVFGPVADSRLAGVARSADPGGGASNLAGRRCWLWPICRAAGGGGSDGIIAPEVVNLVLACCQSDATVKARDHKVADRPTPTRQTSGVD
ncbi:hypothetical protein GCM10029963_76680 [Micromonospora andamanensis]|nr:hypothetical protein Vwe01_62910 [Micromonospora andamanensis]